MKKLISTLLAIAMVMMLCVAGIAEGAPAYIAENAADILEHALECVRIIKLEKKLSKEHKKQPEPVFVDEDEAKEATGATLIVNVVTEADLKLKKKSKKK